METDINLLLDAALLASWSERREALRRLCGRGDVSSGLRDDTAARRNAITPEQYAVLTALDRAGHGIPVREIAEQADAPYANVTRTLDRLERKGLIRRNRDTVDKRRIIIRLTLEGGKIARRLRDVTRKLHASLWGRYSEEEKKALLGLLQK